MRKRNHAFLLLAIALSSRMEDRFASRRYLLKNKLGDRMIKQLLNSVIAKYRDFSVSRRSIICLSLRLIDLLATDKSRYFAQPHPIIANYWFLIFLHYRHMVSYHSIHTLSQFQTDKAFGIQSFLTGGGERTLGKRVHTQYH